MSPRALRWKDRRRRDDGGSSAVEFALVVIPLFILLCGIIQASAWMWAKQAGASAIHEGARRAAVKPACEPFEDYVKGQVGSAAAAWSADPVTRTYKDESGVTTADPEVGGTVVVTLTFEPVGHIGLLPAFPAISETTSSRIEHVPETAGGVC